MGRLFWKFFGAFWIGLATVALIVAAGVWLARWFDLVPVSRAELGRMNFYMQTTAGLIRMGDMGAVRHIIGAVEDETHAAPYVIDGQGKDLLGRVIESERWSQIQAAPEQLDLAEARRGLGALQRVATADGSVVTVFTPAEAMRTALGKAAEQTPPPFWLPMLATVLISTLFGGFMAWYVSRPIRTLQWALQRLAAGQLDTRVQAQMGSRRDELAELGADFDRMAQRMQLLVGAQRRLLHDVSHELRSPLARMQAAIGLARQQPERAPAMHERVERESTRLDALVGELLTLARLETDGAQAASEHIDVVELLAEVCDDARFEARAAQRDLVFTTNGEYLAEVRGELLFRAFENVVRNAVKFTREGTVVSVHAEVSADGLVVTVSDQGPGVPEEAHHQMFEPFQRVGDAGVDGFGLGLTIAKRAIESHGGRIEAHAAPGGGLAIRMSLGVARRGA
jgi:two-component system, OmpR family, sensor kinase